MFDSFRYARLRFLGGGFLFFGRLSLRYGGTAVQFSLCLFVDGIVRGLVHARDGLFDLGLRPCCLLGDHDSREELAGLHRLGHDGLGLREFLGPKHLMAL